MVPLATNGTIGKITNGTIGRTPNRARVNEKGVQKLLKELNTHKATGPDEVPSSILQIGAKELALVIVKLYQYLVDTAEVTQN